MSHSGDVSSNISDDSDTEDDQKKFTNREINNKRDIRSSSSSSYSQGINNTDAIEYNNGLDPTSLSHSSRLSINTNDDTSYYMMHPRSPNRTGEQFYFYIYLK